MYRLAITCVSQATIAASQKEGVCINDDGVLGVLNSSNAWMGGTQATENNCYQCQDCIRVPSCTLWQSTVSKVIQGWTPKACNHPKITST